MYHLLLCPHGTVQYEHEKEPSYWDAQARATLDAALKLRPRDHRAKNLILFLGDGKVTLLLWNLILNKPYWLYLAKKKKKTNKLQPPLTDKDNGEVCAVTESTEEMWLGRWDAVHKNISLTMC